MKVLLVAPQSKDTILGTIGCYCKDTLIDLGYEVETFDFRQSQYLKGSVASFVKKIIKKFFPKPVYRIPLVNSLENEKMNKLLLKVTEEYRPNIFFVLMGDGILSQTLEKIKNMGITTVNWFHDSVLAPIRKDFVENISKYYDYFFMIDSVEVLNYIKISSGCVKTIPLACIPEIHKTLSLSEKEIKKYGSEVSFVGTVKFKRAEVLSSLTEFDLGIWGYWLEKEHKLKNCYRKQHIFGREAIKIYNASKIILDIHLSYGTGDRKFNVTPRVFEVPASGGFLLVDETPQMTELYEIGKEIICYEDENDLKEKIRYYLAHPEERKLIAQKGQERAYRDHTYENRLKEIFSIIGKNN
jgi:spore maturation protein CgeB